MEKLRNNESIVLPCNTTITFQETRYPSMARLVSNVDVEGFDNNEQLADLSIKNMKRIRIKKESIKPLIKFLQRLDLTLEGGIS